MCASISFSYRCYMICPQFKALKYYSFYHSVIRFQIFRVNRGTWLVNSRHVTQTQTSVYFGTDVLQWSCSTRASPPWRDDITEGITYVITRVSAKTYVCFLCERTQAISVNPSSLKPLSQLAHDHFKTLCDHAFWHSHDGSPTLHELSLPLHAIFRSPAVASDF